VGAGKSKRKHDKKGGEASGLQKSNWRKQDKAKRTRVVGGKNSQGGEEDMGQGG